MVNIENGNVNKGQSNLFLKVEISKASSGHGPTDPTLLSSYLELLRNVDAQEMATQSIMC